MENEAPTLYHVFAGWQYYPDGGVDDYFGAFSSFDEAVNIVKTRIEAIGHCSWGHVALIGSDGRLVKVWDHNQQSRSS